MTKAERTDLNFRRQRITVHPPEGATHSWCRTCTNDAWSKGRQPHRDWIQKWKLPDPRNWFCPVCKDVVEFYTEEGDDVAWTQGGIWRFGTEWFTAESWKTADFGYGVPDAHKRRKPEGGNGGGSRTAETPGPGWSANSWWSAPSGSSSSSSKWRRR